MAENLYLESCRTLLEGLADAVGLADLNGNILYVNPAFEKVTGYKKSEIEGRPAVALAKKLVVPPEAKGVLQNFRRIPTGRNSNAPSQFRIRRKDGKEIYVLGSAGQIRDGAGNLVFIEYSMREITNMVEGERKLRESELRYRRLFETAKDAILIIDSETGKIIDSNPYLSEVLGYPQSHFIGKRLWQISPLKDIAGNKGKFRELRREKYMRYEYLPLETKAGKRLEVEFVSNVYLVGKKKIVQCNIRNITERKKSEEEKELNSKRLASFVKDLNNANIMLSESEAKAKETDILNKVIAETGGAKSIDSLLKTTLDSVMKHMGFEGGGIYLIDWKKRLAEMKLSKGLPKWFISEIESLSVDAKPYAKIFIKKRPIIMDNYAGLASARAKRSGFKSLASIPLVSRGKVLGALNVASKTLRAFTETEKRLLFSIGREVGAALARMLAENKIKEAARRMKILNQIISKSASARDMETLLKSLSRSTIKLLDFDFGGAYILNKEEGTAKLRYSEGIPKKFLGKVGSVKTSDKPYDVAFSGERALFVEDYPSFDPEFAKGTGILSATMLPVKSGGSVIATLNFGSRRRKSFSNEERHILKSVAIETTGAISRMLSREKLKKSEAKFRTVVENVRMHIGAIDELGVFTIWNKYSEKMLGYKGEEAIGKLSPRELFETEKEYRELLKTARTEGLYDRETNFVRKDGSVFPVHLIVAPRREGKKTTGYYGIAEDITERKRAENSLRQSEEKYRNLAETLNEGIWLLDKGAKTTFVNPALAEMLGYSGKELLGTPAADFLDSAGERKMKEMMKRRKAGKKDRYELDFYKKDGKKMRALVSASPVKDEKGNYAGSLAGIIDITAEKAAEEELRKAYAELMKVDEMKDDFMNIAAHELKTPLVTVIGYLDILQSGRMGKLSEEQKNSINIAYRNTRRLQLLINDIIDITKLESGTMRFNVKKFGPAKAILNVASDFRERAKEKRLHLKVDLPHKLKTITADERRVAQVLANLIDNAIKFTDKGAITISAKPGKNHLDISVTDTGKGINPSDMDKLFEKFFIGEQVLQKIGGTGLGLAICKGIALAHGGDILVGSKRGKGSTFTFRLPYTAAALAPGKFAVAIPQETFKKNTALKGAKDVQGI